mgnify:FL=1
MKKYQADWVFPVTSPAIANGIVIMDDHGRIEAVLPEGEAGEDVLQLPGLICPGFINAHVHLELSWMKGLIAEDTGLDGFISELEQTKPVATPELIAMAIERAVHQMATTGTVGYGDICNTANTLQFKQSSRMRVQNFVEVFGSHPAKAQSAYKNAQKLHRVFRAMLPNQQSSIVPHATYSVSSELFRQITQNAVDEQSILSIHHAESLAEIDLFSKSQGLMHKRLEQWGIPPDYLPFAGKRPIDTLKGLLPTQNRWMFVHNTFLQEPDLKVIKDNFTDVWFTLCPRSNYYIERSQPPFELIRSFSDNILLGTDSLASVGSLNMVEEIRFVMQSNKGITFDEALKWATINGAKFFGWDSELGSIEVGKRPGLVNIIGFEANNSQVADSMEIKLV